MAYIDFANLSDLEREAYIDNTLKVLNKNGSLIELNQIFSSRKNKGYLLKLYLEDFKSFNEMFGYSAGDKLLQEIVQFLRSVVPGSICRYGGVEFILPLEKMDFIRANELALSILDRFESAWKLEDIDCVCSASAGLVAYPEMAENAEDALKMLDYAVREAAVIGQNQVAVYDGAMARKMYRRQHIAGQLKTAIQDGSIEIRYRPTYSVEDGKFTWADTYLRLHSPEFGAIPAAEFLPIAEDTGLIFSINQYAIRSVCRFIRELLDEQVEFEGIAVQASPIQLLQERFVEDVRAYLEEYDIPASKLGLEVAESTLINSFQAVNINMQELSDMGVKLILNEFGTGYSGINNILSLPVDILKLERMFVWELETDPRSAYLIEGLIQIARKLDLKVTAEGVETENQNRLLKQYQCSYLQGFYYSATVERGELKNILNHPAARQ